MLRQAGAGLRIVRAVGHGLRGLWLLRWRFPGFSPAEREACIEQWARHMLGIFNVTLRVEGPRQAGGPLLVVANHLSWLDILVMQATRNCRFVSKAEVRRWPLIGAVAAGSGTLFIARESRRDALRVVHHMAARLRAGDVLAVFPEGTTGDGERLLPFHGNLLQAAISAGAPVQPLGIRFIDAATGRRSQAASYVGDDTLLASIWRTLTSEPIVAMVRLGEPQHAEGRDRRAWAEALHAQVDVLR
ncbi:lysophospholipid acyltransferase family protein [Xylophilus sp. ASV27]|uniref:lysophospholipid acyltransferase family protein n=1 Tax=Xylophilus sp. ASV27 TaxID=2795129 RepID=UPI00351C697B